MCSDAEYKSWENGDKYLCIDSPSKSRFLKGKFYTVAEVEKFFETMPKWQIRKDYFNTMSEYFDDDYLEIYEDTYTTASNELVHAFGKYGEN